MLGRGRKSLYITAGECIGIEGLPDDEGVALIEELHAHCLRSEFHYRHKWQVGDLLIGTTQPRCISQSVTIDIQNGD
jgi:taurine dioxygenase